MNSCTTRSRGASALLAVLTCTASLVFAAPSTAQSPQTTPETSGFQEYTGHGEMMEYLETIRASSTDMRIGSYGETREGRELPYVIFSRPMITKPSEAAMLGRPVVLLAANVHGGERTLRESLLLLMRDIARPGTPENALLDHMVILAVPQINPDGFHATERGQRGNAWGIDLNRDYVKLEHPEIAGYVNLLSEWTPHLFIDGHNGGSFPYNVNYQCPSHASPDQRITLLCDQEIFPAIDRALEANGYKSFFYTGGNENRWNTGGWQARIGRNYGGFTNTVGILFESPGGQDMEPAVRSGYLAYKAVLDWVRDNPQQLMNTVNTARLETIAMGLAAEGDVVVDMRYDPEDYQVTYEIGEGQGDDRRIIQVTSDSLMKKPVPTQTRPRPYAYILPRDAVDAVAMLRRHGITVERLQEDVTLNVQAYTVGDITYTRQYNHAAAVEVEVGEVVSVEEEFPRGTYIVQTGQMLGRLVAHMLEPETDDNVIYWNTMDAWLPRPGQQGGQGGPGQQGQQGPALVPIYKLMTPMALPSKIIE